MFDSRFVIVVVSWALISQCSHSEPPPVVEVRAEPIPQPSIPESVKVLDALDQVAPADSARGRLVADIRAILLARIAEESGQHKSAAKNWLVALRSAKDPRFAKLAFASWARSEARLLNERVDAESLADILLWRIKGESDISFFGDKSLTSRESLAAEIRKYPNPYLSPEVFIAGQAGTKIEIEAKLIERFGKEPMLESLAVDYCRSTAQDRRFYDRKINGMSKVQRFYWEGLVMYCQEQYEKAIARFNDILALTKDDNIRLSVSRYMALAHRRLGRRLKAARSYAKVVLAWKSKKLAHGKFAMEQTEFLLRRVNDTIWSARYHGLVGEITAGEAYAKQAIDLLSRSRFLGGERRQAVELQAEAYHVLGARLAVEKRDFDSAIAYANLGLNIPNLSADWRDRFLWYLGLYSYIGGAYSGSQRYWKELLDRTKDENLNPRLFYWLSKVHQKLGNKRESKFYRQSLLREHPLSFYSVVGALDGRLGGNDVWAETFQSLKRRPIDLTERKRFDLERFRDDNEVGRLLLRAEILVIANAGELAAKGVLELSNKMRSIYTLSEKNVPGFVYLSRLQFATGIHGKSISLTYLMQSNIRNFWRQWPDQMLVSFPQPFSDVYSTISRKYSLDSELLYAISRRESVFNPTIKSGAGAIGLMQLVPPTAMRFAANTQINPVDAVKELTDPKVNVTLGSAYLKFLRQRYSENFPAIAAAYNAGEYAVDQWLERRNHSDAMLWVELIPFGETKTYVKEVWRNYKVYQYLSSLSPSWASQINVQIATNLENSFK